MCVQQMPFAPIFGKSMIHVAAIYLLCVPFCGASLTTSTFSTAIAAWRSNPTVAIQEYGAIASWNTLGVRNMDGAFKDGTSNGLQGISMWDVSAVTSMRETFRNIRGQFVNLSAWDVSRVRNLVGTFRQGQDWLTQEHQRENVRITALSSRKALHNTDTETEQRVMNSSVFYFYFQIFGFFRLLESNK